MLNSKIFGVDSLVECYAPPNLHSVMAGNQVMLRSGGPMMIVVEPLGKDNALCRWGEDGEFSEVYQLVCLTCFGAK